MGVSGCGKSTVARLLVAHGATLVCGGRADSTLMAATLLDHVTPAMRIYHDESFGPVVAVIRGLGELEARFQKFETALANGERSYYRTEDDDEIRRMLVSYLTYRTALLRTVWRVRGYGDFYSHVLVAEGAVDIAAEPEVKLWDLAPLDVLVREAGGSFTDLAGVPGPHGGSAVATNTLLHAAAITYLTPE